MKSSLPLKALLISILVMAVGLLSYAIIKESWTDRFDSTLAQVLFSGTWQSSESAEAKPIVENSVPEPKDSQSVLLKGHFEETISAGTPILFRLSNVRFHLFKNGEQIYSFGDPGTFPSFSKSPGDQWDVFIPADNITSADDIQIQIENIYDYKYSDNVFELFLQNIYTGDSNSLLHHLLKTSGAPFFVGGFILLMGLVVLVSFLIMKLVKARVSYALFYLSMLAICGGIWVSLDFNIVSLLISTNVFTNILDFLSVCLCVPFMGLYLLCFVKNKKARIPIWISVYALLVFTLFFLFVQLLGIWDGYELMMPFLILVGTSFILMACSVIFENRNNPGRQVNFVLSSTCLCFVGLGDTVGFFLGISPKISFFTVGFILFIFCQFLYLMYYARKTLAAAIKTQELEKELVQNRISIMLSQIQPHFIFNLLTAIKQLCTMDPPRAEEAVGQFANFLRGNLDSLGQSGLIPFQKELLHIENYISLEKMRFGKRVNIIYQIEFENFHLPPLIVQPMVENAVRYGITKQPKGGTVIISTKDDSEHITITVSDDGVGFHPDVKKEDGRRHIGIDNVRSRLEHQCGGSLHLESIPGTGTTVTIIIPNEKGDEAR